MALPTKTAFLNGLQNQRRAGEPPSLSDICAALDHYHAPSANNEELAAKVYIVYKRSKQWQKGYATPPNGGPLRQEAYQSWQGKYSAVVSLITDAINELDGLFPGLGESLFQYEDRKKAGVRSKKAKPLKPGYDLERKTFVAGGKLNSPFSASKVLDNVDGDDGEARVAKFRKMGATNFTTLGNTIQGVQTMYWCNRMQRLKNRVRFENGQWVTIDGTQVHHPKVNPTNSLANEFELRLYAMDRYGNVFVEEDSAQYARLRLPQRADGHKGAAERARGVANHSSICAGREVICAGNISIWKGQLLHIDNHSGHYGPTREHLQKALSVLAEDFIGMPTMYLRVGVFGKGYYTHAAFMQGMGGPDWPQQDLGVNQDQIFINKGINP
jgi:hypothetical protein